MTTRAAVALVALAGLPAAGIAQDSITYSWAWFEVVANTSTPVSSPNGMVEPGEGVRLSLTALITPGIGSVVTYQSPPPPGYGRLAGLSLVYFDLLGTSVSGGTWSVNRRNPGGVNWALGPPGTPEANGNLSAGAAGQFILPGAIANSTNPVNNIWVMTWTPSDYTSRSASFQSQAAAASQGNHSGILIEYGEDPHQDPQYVGRFIDGVFGNSSPIPIVPAPGAAVLLGLGLLAATGRRRRLLPHRGTPI